MSRERLKRALSRYVTDTLTYMATAKYFYDRFSQWKDWREKEYTQMMSIKEKILKIDPSFTMSEGKHRKGSNYLKSHFQFHKKSRHKKRENELADVLEDTLRGLEELNTFLEAIEKLAVTSLQVFSKNQIVYRGNRINLDHVENMISTAQEICHLLLTFKRDAKSFFLPDLHNVEILASCLRTYIDTANEICVVLGASFDFEMCLNITDEVNTDYLYEDDIQQMINHIEQLDKIRMDENFRMEFLFQEGSSEEFVNMFDSKRDTMQDFLDKLKQCADKLDRMDKGTKISNVAGSSVKAIASVLAIVGLALAPSTAGAALGLTVAGGSLGIASEANSLAANTAGLVVNRNHQKTANTVFQDFMEDFQNIQEYLNDGIKHPTVNLKQSKMDVVKGVTKGALNIRAIEKGIKLIRNYKPLCRKAAVKGRVKEHVGPFKEFGNFANYLFNFGCNISSVVKDSMSLAKGSETKLSMFLRIRLALFHTQITSWAKICESLRKSQSTQEENRNMLKKPFYPVTQTKHQTRQSLQDREESFYSSPPVTTRYVGYAQNTAPFQYTGIQRPIREPIMHSPFDNYYQTRQSLQNREESFYSSPPVTTRYVGYAQNTAPFQYTGIQRPIREPIMHSPFDNYYQTRQSLQDREESFYSSPPVTTRYVGYAQNTAPFQYTGIQRPIREPIMHSPFDNYYQTHQSLQNREESFYSSPPVTTRYVGYAQNTAPFQYTGIQRPIREPIMHSPFDNYYQTR
ncbi:uncharacterized protein LOC111611674 isoform X2 [Xiphophorus maculatus]|uniref:uncharacterized protein LOC111611674 isoform X2 n=1 Tax=Xiphophorus maculatus TaxID=8083 RepID=UPI000C6E7654|nr:uncharacterized protein LOC111611674 isoform X2 [Xiphophorus maculatus]